MKKVLSVADIKELIRGGKLNLTINRQYVDNLNVFPVPDGDTGTNMSLTMTSTVKEMDTVQDGDVRAICAAIAKGALKGARGNSGVILSQILKGITDTLPTEKTITTKVFAAALCAGSEKAYDAVVNPKEGTILTVIRLISDYAERTARRTPDFNDFFAKIIKKGEEVLADTPKLLPVLAKAGVVDSGGQGLLFILQGMYNVLAGIEMKEPEAEEQQAQQTISAASVDENDYENITFSYCTEYFIVNLKKQTTLADIDKLRDKLCKIGDCVLVVGDLSAVKVHVHTNTPNVALEYALKMGDLDNMKIENMREQYKRIHAGDETSEHVEVGVLSICTGEGFKKIFNDFGAKVMEGGQTMNPSVDDIASNVRKVNADTVYILPNNKNIILACERAVEIVDCNLVIVPTKDVLQGIAALTAFDPDCDVETNKVNMTDILDEMTSVEITHAVKDAEADGFEVKTGDIIALSGNIIARGNDVDDVVLDVLKKYSPDDICVVDLYYGASVTEDAAASLTEKVEELLPDCDIRCINGGQPHYDYFISIA